MAESIFLKPLGGYRAIIPQAGETLQQLALRELGDASKWALIAWVNGLRAPYIVESVADLTTGVVMAGTPLLVPDETSEPAPKPADLYYTDLLLARGALSVADGDLSLVPGVSNLAQGLRHRVVVDKRELLYHPEYGCFINRLLGRSNTPQATRLAEFYVRSSLLEDERVRSVQSCVAQSRGDALLVVATVIAVSGVTVDLEVHL
jgi:hypothetical protein